MIPRKFGFPSFFLILVCLAFPAAAQINDTYVIPIVGNTPGVGGTVWQTEFHAFNPQKYPLVVTLVYLPSAEPDMPVIDPKRFDFEVDANSTAYAEDLVGDIFEITGRGALLVATLPEENPDVPDEVLARAFVVHTRTYNTGSGGTFGQSVPGVWAGLQHFPEDGISAIATGIRNRGNVITFQGYRTNIGAVNLGQFSATMYVSVFDSAGQAIATDLPFTIPPEGHVQDRLPVEVEHGSIEFIVEDPRKDAVVFAYASVVDNRTGDGTYINPILLASPGILFKGALPKINNLNPADVGIKINSAIARRIAARAEHLGTLKMGKEGKIER